MTDRVPFELRFALLSVGLAATSLSCRHDSNSDAQRAPNAEKGAALATSAPVTTRAPAAAPSEAPVVPSLALSASAAGGVPCAPPPPPGAPLPKLEKRTLATKKDGHYRFELQYPLLKASDDATTEKVNRLLADRLATLQKRFVKEAQNQGGEADPDNARWFEGKCDVAHDSPSFVSVACETMEGPGAHPNVDKFAHTFQLCPEVKPVALADLCRALPECRKRIVALINEDFRTGDKKQTGIQFRVGPASSADPADSEQPVANLQSFGITPAGLRIFLFDELPHVLQGFGVVDIPVAKVRSVLREDTALRIWGP
ncbi:MAG: hypothetical protein ABW133_10815 [Polyangiaceae bacterium]